jgi:putative transposase
MSRIARFIEENGFYHIISRSINDNRILRDDKDFSHFLKLMCAAKKQYPFHLFHYVIMNTHFHFIVRALSHKMLSQGLAYLKWCYTLWCRRKYCWKGPLWRERYTSIPIENEDYLYNCGVYIEYNPVRAGICTNPVDYRFSSYKKYQSGITDPVLDDYENNFNFSQYATIDYTSDLAKDLFSRSSAVGSVLFINKLKRLAMPQNGCPKK